MDETLSVHRDADIISGVFCKLAKFVLGGFIKGLCPEKDKCCTSKIYLEDQDISICKLKNSKQVCRCHKIV